VVHGDKRTAGDAAALTITDRERDGDDRLWGDGRWIEVHARSCAGDGSGISGPSVGERVSIHIESNGADAGGLLIGNRLLHRHRPLEDLGLIVGCRSGWFPECFNFRKANVHTCGGINGELHPGDCLGWKRYERPISTRWQCPDRHRTSVAEAKCARENVVCRIGPVIQHHVR